MSLDPTKAHGCDNLSIKNVKICSMSITVPLKIKFEQLLKEGKFPEIWKIIVLSAYFLFLVKFSKD